MTKNKNHTKVKRLFEEQTFTPCAFHSVLVRTLSVTNKQTVEHSQHKLSTHRKARLEPAIEDAQQLAQNVFPPWISEAVSRGILLFFFFSRGKIAPGTSSFFSLTFSCFVLLIPPSVLLFWAVWTPLKHFTSLSAMFVYIRVPPNNPIMKRARLVWVPGYHSSPKWAINTSRPSRDSYRAFNSQPRCQNPRSGSLCCKSIFALNLPLNNA